MARTKQTAHKVTGGKAPKKQLQCTYHAKKKYTGKKRPAPANTTDSNSSQDEIVPIESVCQLQNIQHLPGVVLELDQETLTAFADMEVVDDAYWKGVDVLKEKKLTEHYEKGEWPQPHVQVRRQRDNDAPEGSSTWYTTASKDLKKDELIGVVTGRLMEKEKFVQDLPDQDSSENLWSYDIPQEQLEAFGYQGPDLVLSLLDGGNDLRFAQDASWYKDDDEHGDSNNATVYLGTYYHPDHPNLPVPMAFVYANKRIRKGQDVTIFWGEGPWASMHQIQIIKQGGANHKLHLKNRHLAELIYLKTGARLKGDSGSSSLSKLISFNPDQSHWCWDSAPRATAAAEATATKSDNDFTRDAEPTDKPFELLSLEQVKQVFGDGACSSRGLVMDWTDDLFCKLPMSFRATCAKLQAPGPKQQKTVTGEGIFGVAEIKDLHHPVRWCTNPDVTAYTAIALRDIKKSTPLCDYIGTVMLDDNVSEGYRRDAMQQTYTYGISGEQLKALGLNLEANPAWKKGLVVDNRVKGNISRYINCAYGRADPPPGNRKEHVNVAATEVFNTDIRLPAVQLSATSYIRKGEELVVDYGEQYWRVIARALMIEQKDYAVRAMLRQEQLLTKLEQLLAVGILSKDEYNGAVEWDVDLSKVSVFEL